MTLTTTPLLPSDRPTWEALALAYKAFYQSPISDDELALAWHRLLNEDGVHGLGVRLDGQLVGISHYLFHTSTWARRVCYLQDLYVDPDSRGQGAARALIEQVAVNAKEQGAQRLYWLTQEHNTTARALYDRVAQFNGFIRYDYPL